ncbi:hypothetical protein JRQ81_013921 [Phrynocephalus forsythii]|uniref:Hematopoietic progenitor cell antigen CD34 n=1 Tax=Phrynocephalus forsythii TaxID=171643 RepID=A0A9Q1B2M1_9SAUR|nr:hypothetical protein JRQ81_013921 [Phrynocephalus forsythii]
MLQWSFKAMKKGHLFWTAFYVLSLLVSGDGEADLNTLNINAAILNTTSSTLMPKVESSTGKVVMTTVSPTSPEKAAEAKKEVTDNSSVTVITTTLNSTVHSTVTTVQLSSAQNNSVHTSSNGTIGNIIPTTSPTASSTEQTTQNYSILTRTTQTIESTVTASITCVNIKEVTTQVICLELANTLTCEQFKSQKEKDLGRVLCMTNSTCHIKLSESSVKQNSLLVIDLNNSGADAVYKLLIEKTHDLEKLGIKKIHKPESIDNHKNYSRKTLIALVTSGLLMAFLGLAGYHFMKRRSWSPRGERLGEDPYYTENGGHGNPGASVASHEQSSLQDKPNLNGGARENGTGQTASKNGHSTKPHVVADTEL